jgi:single-strand DNA-binding protein
MHMRRLTLIGNLGVEPEVGTTQKGAPIATLRVAVNHQRTDTTTGERQEQTEWFRVRAMGRLVEPAQRLSKGGRVLVVGRFDIGHYQTRDGEPRTSFDVWADELVSLSALRESSDVRRENDSGQPASSPATNRPLPPRRAAPPTNATPNAGEDEDDQDLPW